MPGTYPPAASAAGYFVGYILMGWAGTPTTTAQILTIKSGNPAAYWYAYKSCTVYQLTTTCITTNSVAATLTLQPWGNASGGATAAALGSSAAVSIPSSGGPFVTHSYTQNFTLAAGGYVGISATSSVSNSAMWINVSLWVSQAGT